MSNYLIGEDAVDLARITGLDLFRMPYGVNDKADTGWKVADDLIAKGEATVDDFLFDLDRLSNEHASHTILSLVGFLKAWHASCIL